MKIHWTMMGLAAVAGCAWLPSVGPDYEKPEVELPEYPLPDAGSPTAECSASGEYKISTDDEDCRISITTNDVQNWWTRFNDPVLTGLVNDSVSNNISFLMAQERMMEARWRLLGSYAAFLPHVNASASATQLEKGPNTSAMVATGRTLHQNVFAGGFDATWEIDIFGGSRRMTEASWAEAAAMGWHVADAWVSLTSEVGSQYVTLRTVQSRIEVARTNLAFQIETYEILKSRFDSGIGDELAVNQSLYVMNQTHAAIPPLLAEEERLKNAIAILTGDLPGSRHEELESTTDRDWLLAPSKLETMPINMIRSRPDVRIAERELAAQVAYVGVAKAQWFPKLYINGALGLEATKMNKLFKRNSFFGSIGPAVSWPIFQGGNIYANVKSEEAKMNEKYLNYELVLDKAYGEVRNAYAAYTQEYHRYQALQSATKAAQDAVGISRDLYKTGLRDFTAVIDAQRSLLTLQEALVISRGQITQNLIALYKALGGGIVVE